MKKNENNKLLNIEINGISGSFPENTKIIEAAEKLGIEIPHFCYNKYLKIAGSCRMCMIEIEGNPKLQLSCSTEIQEGMKIKTDSEKVIKARKGVLEFLLLNHPLDCPVCDKAGECDLQNYYFDFSSEESRINIEKWTKDKNRDLGGEIILDQERCILCTRCIRFMDEYAQNSVLGVFGRGSESKLDIMPGREFTDHYSMNTVDLCPVGALTSKDFRFRKRVWFLESKTSVCPHCSTGCTINIESERNRIYRIRPEENPEINKSFMCNFGRLAYRDYENSNMKTSFINSQPVKIETLEKELKNDFFKTGKNNKYLILTSYYLTNEEAYLVFKLSNQLKTENIVFIESSKGLINTDISDNFLLNEDKSPNKYGIKLISSIFPKQKIFSENPDEFIEKNDFNRLIIIGPDLIYELNENSREKIRKTESVLTHNMNMDKNGKKYKYEIPFTHFYAKDGSFINRDGYLQKLNKIINEKFKFSSIEILSMFLNISGQKNRFTDAEHVFNKMKNEIQALKNIEYSNIPQGGEKI